MATSINGTIDLQQRWNINWQRNAQLKNLVNPDTGLVYTYQSAKDRFPREVGYCEYKGWQPSEVLNLYEFEIAWNEAFWITWGYFTETSPAYGDMRSRGSILAPDGFYLTAYGCLFGYGRYIAKGTNIYSSSTPPNVGCTAGTGLGVDHANWMTTRALERMPLRSCSWGLDSGNAYMQGTVIEGFYLDGGCGDKAYDPSFVSYGLGMWDSGESSAVRNCYASGFNNYGLCFPKGTPTYVEACSCFSNGQGGLAILGNNGLSTSTITDLSGDDNGGGLLVVQALPGQASGGTIVVNGIKSENGKRTPYRQQRVIVAKGALNMVVNGVSADSQNETVPYAFDIDFQTYPGQVAIQGARLNGYNDAVRLTANGNTKMVASPDNFVPFSITVNETGVVNSTRTMPVSGGSASPTITSFTATPNTLTGAGTVTLAWATTNATGVTISGVSGALTTSGTKDVPVSTTTSFTLVASNATGSTASAITVTVNASGGNIIPLTGVTVTASENSASEPKENTIDGNPATVWSSRVAQSSGDHWVEWKFPAQHTFTRIDFGLPDPWKGDYARSYDIGIGNVSNPASAIPGLGVGAQNFSVSVNSVKGTTVRKTFKRVQNVSNWATLGTVVFYGT